VVLLNFELVFVKFWILIIGVPSSPQSDGLKAAPFMNSATSPSFKFS